MISQVRQCIKYTIPVFFDDDAEAILAALCEQTGLSISDVLRRGLESYAEVVREGASTRSFEVYRRLDLGPGGYAIAPARDAKAALVEALRDKHPG